MAFTKEHAAQMAQLRQLGRTLGGLKPIATSPQRTGPRLSSADRRAQNLALRTRLSELLGPSETEKRGDGTGTSAK